MITYVYKLNIKLYGKCEYKIFEIYTYKVVAIDTGTRCYIQLSLIYNFLMIFFSLVSK